MGHDYVAGLVGSLEGPLELMVLNWVKLVIMIMQPCLAVWEQSVWRQMSGSY